MTKHSDSKAAKIRALLADGQKAKDIASILDVSQQYVYGVQNYERRKQKKAAATAATRVSPITGKPVRKYKKRKAAKAPVKKVEALIVVPKPEFLSMQQELEALRNRRPIEIEVPVPQPFSHYTFVQRLRILFLGGTA